MTYGHYGQNLRLPVETNLLIQPFISFQYNGWKVENRQQQFYDEFGDKLDGFGISSGTEEWMNKFDRLIRNWNSKIHFRDWNALGRNVIEMCGLFLRHPILRDMLEDKHHVIQNFE